MRALLLLALAGCLDPRAQFCGDKVCAPEASCDEATSTCVPAGCGDGVLNNKEQCDGAELGGVIDCASLGFYDHSPVTCTVGCELDTRMCSQSCGDHAVNGPELCDGDVPPGQSCLDYGFGMGRIACASACTPAFGGCTAIGLDLEFAYTRALHGIDGRSRTDAWAVGGSGTLLHFDGHAWTPAGTSAIGFQAVWVDKAPGAKQVVAVGDDGTGHAAIARFDGTAWHEEVLANVGGANAVWGHGADVWVVGGMGDGTGYAIEANGAQWGTPVPAPAALDGIAGDPVTGHAVAVGASKTTGVLDGGAWTFVKGACMDCTASNYSLQAVLALDNNEYIAVGSSPTMEAAVAAQSLDGGVTWTSMPQQTTKLTTLVAISGVRGDVYIAGTGGTLLRYDGRTFHEVQTGTIAAFSGVWRAADDDVHVLVNNGEIRRIGAAAWVDAGKITPEPARLQAVATSPNGQTIIAGSIPATLRASTDGRTWADPTGGIVGSNRNLTGVWFPPSQDPTATADEAYVTFASQGNVLYRPKNGAFSITQPLPAGTQPTAIFGFSPADIYIAATGAQVFHGTSPTTWTGSTPGGSSDLTTVWGSGPSDVYIGGEDGLLAHSTNGATWTPVSIPGLTANITGIWGTGPSDVFAVGAKGTILHFDGAAWRYQHTGNEDLAGVFGIAVADPAHPGQHLRATDVFAFGTETLFHYDGVSWSPMALPLLFGALAATSLPAPGRNDVIFVGTRGNAATLARPLSQVETRCSDGWDDDRNGLVDCADPACAHEDICAVGGGTCRIAGSLACDATTAGTTFTGISRIDLLPMTAALTDGPEATFRYDATTSGSVTLAFDTAQALSVAVLPAFPGTAACDLQSPLAGRTGPGELTFAVTAGKSYAIVVDEAAGNAGDFTLSLACP